MFFTPGTSFTPRCTACETIFWLTRDGDAPRTGKRSDGVLHQPADRIVLTFRRIAELDFDRDLIVAGTRTLFTAFSLTKSLPVCGSITVFRQALTSASDSGIEFPVHFG